MTLDLDDPRPPYLQVAALLRAAILTKKLSPGEQLPSQMELSRRYEVSRMTVQQALRILKDEGLVTSRQGSGMFVRQRTSRPVGLRPHVELAFQQPNVRIDFSGYTAETLHGIITEPLDRIREGLISPQSIDIRLLVSDMTRDLALPVGTHGDPERSLAIRNRMADISARHAGGIRDAVDELVDLELVPKATVQSRNHGSAPLFKAYIINDLEVFFGYYPVVEHTVRIDGERVPIFDPMGKDAVLFQYSGDDDPESTGTQFVAQTRKWFDSIWDSIAKPTA